MRLAGKHTFKMLRLNLICFILENGVFYFPCGRSHEACRINSGLYILANLSILRSNNLLICLKFVQHDMCNYE